MSDLQAKIEAAESVIADVLVVNAHPVIACSFGKDSMVMLDLLRRMGHNFPVIYWPLEHFFPKKHSFAHRIVELWDLPLYSYSPLAVRMVKKGEHIDIVNYFQVGHDKSVTIPSGIVPPQEGEPFLCGLHDMYHKPLGNFRFPWDVIFCGHKNSDVDPMQGAVPLRVDVTETEPKICFPLRHFTDADVWEYTEKFNVPQDRNRYKADGSQDIAFNNDHYAACIACMKPGGDSVVCPKSGEMVPNVAAHLDWVEADSLRQPYWGN